MFSSHTIIFLGEKSSNSYILLSLVEAGRFLLSSKWMFDFCIAYIRCTYLMLTTEAMKSSFSVDINLMCIPKYTDMLWLLLKI